MWTPYEIKREKKPDFLVSYRFFTHEEGGRKQLPFQGYRSDLHYDGEDIQRDGSIVYGQRSLIRMERLF